MGDLVGNPGTDPPRSLAGGKRERVSCGQEVGSERGWSLENVWELPQQFLSVGRPSSRKCRPVPNPSITSLNVQLWPTVSEHHGGAGRPFPPTVLRFCVLMKKSLCASKGDLRLKFGRPSSPLRSNVTRLSRYHRPMPRCREHCSVCHCCFSPAALDDIWRVSFPEKAD